MLFVGLSFVNARRNISRSLLAIVGIALAAGVFTGAAATGSGYARHAFSSYRQFAGADIVAYADGFPFRPPDEPEVYRLATGGDDLVYRYDLATYFSDITVSPYLKREGRAFEMDELLRFGEVAQVTGVYPYLALPVFVLDANGEVIVQTVLRGRYAEVDERRWELDLFSSQQQHQWVCVTNSQATPHGGWGDTLRIEVPSIVEHTAQGTVFDYQARHGFQLERIGDYAFVIDREYVEEDVVEIFLENKDVLVPSGIWHEIFTQASGGKNLQYVHQVGVTVDSMFLADQTQVRLSEQVSRATILSVPELARMSGSMPPAEAPDVSGAYVVMAFALSAMMASTNMFILVTQRQRELGVLKAIGASGRELFVLLLSETAVFALLGALVGYGVVMLFLVLFYFASDVTAVQASATALSALGQVLGLALATGLVAGVLPAWYAVRATTREVLDHE